MDREYTQTSVAMRQKKKTHNWSKGRFRDTVLHQLYRRSVIKIRIPGPTFRNSSYKSKARVTNPLPQHGSQGILKQETNSTLARYPSTVFSRNKLSHHNVIYESCFYIVATALPNNFSLIILKYLEI